MNELRMKALRMNELRMNELRMKALKENLDRVETLAKSNGWDYDYVMEKLDEIRLSNKMLSYQNGVHKCDRCGHVNRELGAMG